MHEAGILILGVESKLPVLNVGILLKNVGVQFLRLFRQIETHQGRTLFQTPINAFFRGRRLVYKLVVACDRLENGAAFLRGLEEQVHPLLFGLPGKFLAEKTLGPQRGVHRLVVANEKQGYADVGLFPDGVGKLAFYEALTFVFFQRFQDGVITGNDGFAVAGESLHPCLLDPDTVKRNSF